MTPSGLESGSDRPQSCPIDRLPVEKREALDRFCNTSHNVDVENFLQAVGDRLRAGDAEGALALLEGALSPATRSAAR